MIIASIGLHSSYHDLDYPVKYQTQNDGQQNTDVDDVFNQMLHGEIGRLIFGQGNADHMLCGLETDFSALYDLTVCVSDVPL